jgi:Rrf2 family transcriptional regulator, nitric oxide-sensitive transcriptional repressor
VHLSVHTDYSLRLLMYLALKGEAPATVAEAADYLRVSRNHLMKVVYRLGRGGYVLTLRGKSGGFRLARPPAEISLGDVVRYTETDMSLVPCFANGELACTFLPDCQLRQAMHGALRAFITALDRTSVADLTRQRSPLQAVLAQHHGPVAALARERGGRRPAKRD